MGTRRLKAIIDSEFDDSGTRAAERGMTNVERAAEGQEQALGRTNLRWTELASGLNIAQQAFGTVSNVARVAYEALGEGAELNRARGQFDNLTVSIGSTADVMLTRLRQATAGTVDDAALIANSSDLMKLKLAETEDEVVRMSTVVGKLGLDMNVLGLTINNMSIARLDALGLAVADVVPRWNELKATMGDQEAFKTALVEALEQKVELLGDTTDDTVAALQRMEATWTNVNNAFKQGLASGATDSIKQTGASIDLVGAGVTELVGTLGESLVPAILRTIDPAGQLQRQLARVGIEAELETRRLEALGGATLNWRHSAGLTETQIAELTRTEGHHLTFLELAQRQSIKLTEAQQAQALMDERVAQAMRSITDTGLNQWVIDTANAFSERLQPEISTTASFFLERLQPRIDEVNLGLENLRRRHAAEVVIEFENDEKLIAIRNALEALDGRVFSPIVNIVEQKSTVKGEPSADTFFDYRNPPGYVEPPTKTTGDQPKWTYPATTSGGPQITINVNESRDPRTTARTITTEIAREMGVD